jgi:hypothetical protein
MHAQITINVFIGQPPRQAQTSKSPPRPISPIHRVASSRGRDQLKTEFANSSGQASEHRNATRRFKSARVCKTLRLAPIPKFGLTQDDLELQFPGSRNAPPIHRTPSQLSFDELLDWANTQDPNPFIAGIGKLPKKCFAVTARRGAND